MDALTALVQRARPGSGNGGGGGSDAHYLHAQLVPDDTWIIMHGLGKYPSVTVMDDSGFEVEAEVQHVNNNQVVVAFSSPQSGKASFN